MRNVSAIIPAFNEEKTIQPIVRLAIAHPLIDDVTVVSDGSTDTTAEIARSTGAQVIELKKNQGKGKAMDIGVENARHDIFVFIDADLHGLTEEMITKLLHPVINEEMDMTTLRSDRMYDSFILKNPMLDLSGERAMHRHVWESVPEKLHNGFYIEPAINHVARKKKYKTQIISVAGLRHSIKEHKYGLWKGFLARIQMTLQWLHAYVLLLVCK